MEINTQSIRLLGLSALLAFAWNAPAAGLTPVFINEIHYDNTGADAGEFVEIAGPASTSLAGWDLVYYNGSNGTSYATDNLGGTIPDQCNGFGTVATFRAGIQNGAPDGVALVDNGTVVQFLSYEGSFTATDGPANGMLSTDIGVAETSSTPVGESLQLGGSGSNYEDFTWKGPADDSPDACNSNQTFGGPVSVEAASWGQVRALYR